ncbi:hypothetical protein SAMN04487905_109127 [Actinopolyspora xinjiangensis]|uniref:Uncharacterized protein n=1 Tax=Actinopolyspora xinjiangensis TaxID=405564 RepID=A0A1H0VP60_9ACTN|nr:hypothetical protein [Actinopolyspora xinjiangensis]SDP80230.1 hypothetical protein SAMN04487905_109127 [Actinopolyspora xinjiangensis]
MWQPDAVFWDVLRAVLVAATVLSWPLLCVLLGRLVGERRVVPGVRVEGESLESERR